MFVVETYSLAVAMVFVTMLCWGSWGNTQKLASREWPFQLFYWDYAVGVLLLALILAFTMGSTGGSAGRPFLQDLGQAESGAIGSALLGGVVFNLSNILLVAAIDIAGMAVAFPVGVGLALVLGVITNYIGQPEGDPLMIALGVGLVVVAIGLNALSYSRLPNQGKNTTKGLAISVIAGVLMGFFYRFVAASMSEDFVNPEVGKMGPYAAVVIFSVGLLLSNFVWNTIMMVRPLSGRKVSYGEYFKGSAKLHAVGILGGMIWNLGMAFNIVASGAAGYAISYGLGQGATMIGAFWGVFIWKEFRDAPAGTNKYLAWMFVSFFVGLGLIIYAKVV